MLTSWIQKKASVAKIAFGFFFNYTQEITCEYIPALCVHERRSPSPKFTETITNITATRTSASFFCCWVNQKKRKKGENIVNNSVACDCLRTIDVQSYLLTPRYPNTINRLITQNSQHRNGHLKVLVIISTKLLV